MAQPITAVEKQIRANYDIALAASTRAVAQRSTPEQLLELKKRTEGEDEAMRRLTRPPVELKLVAAPPSSDPPFPAVL